MVEVTTGRKYAVRMKAIPRTCLVQRQGQAEREGQPERDRHDRVEERVPQGRLKRRSSDSSA